MHGNSGGWQFGYRYAIAILPFLFVIMLESSPKNITPLEWAAYILIRAQRIRDVVVSLEQLSASLTGSRPELFFLAVSY